MLGKLTVVVRDEHDFNRSLRKFTKMVQDSGKLRVVREKQAHVSKVEERKRAKKAAKARLAKKNSSKFSDK